MAREFYGSGEIILSNNPTTSNIHHHHQQHQMINQIRGYDETNSSDHHHHQIFSMNTNMGVIDFSKHVHQISTMTSGLELEETSGGDENLLLGDSSSSMRCLQGGSVFPCEVNDRPPSQGLSLSLSSANPSTISLQSFELRPQTQQAHHHVRQGYFGKSNQNFQHTQMLMMMNNTSTNYHHHHQFQIGSSKYLAPAQELLNEFCSLGTKQNDEEIKRLMVKKKCQWDSNNKSTSDHDHSSGKHVPPFHSLEFMELQKRKTKLLSMLEELERRYRHYCEQMRAAVSAFEAAAGVGAAVAYTSLASKAMSRHFRCLRDSIVGHIQATKKAMGEKDPVAPGTTRGETPRLRLLDHAFRQHKAFQQTSLMEVHPWRPQRGLPELAVSILRAWLFEHFLNPYPSDADKHILARQTGLSRSQVSNWFINARVRLWKPMIEEMYSEEAREEPGNTNNNNIIIHSSNNASSSSEHHDSSMINPRIVNPKSEPNQLIRIDPDSLSSIITNPSSKKDPKTSHHHHHHQGTSSFGKTFDFPSYGHHDHQGVTYAAGDSASQGFNGGTGGVSLTLGLPQHGGNCEVSLAFSAAAAAADQTGPLFYGRAHMEDCQQGVQYASMLDGDQAPNLPYRNLMGAQLLDEHGLLN